MPVLLLIALVLGLACFAGWYALSSNSIDAASLSSQLKKHDAFKFSQAQPVSDVPFINEEGQTVGKDQNLGKWSLLFFGYTFCPDICPTTLSVMQQMWMQLTPAVQETTQVVFVSVDIDRDMIERYRVDKPQARPEPRRLIETSWPDGRRMYIANNGKVNFMLTEGQRGTIPYFERGVDTRLVPNDGSAKWKELYAAARKGPHFVKGS